MVEALSHERNGGVTRGPFLSPDCLLLRMQARALSTEQIKSDYVRNEIERMMRIARGEQEKEGAYLSQGRMVGVAHPQVATKGDPLRIIVIDRSATGEPNGPVGGLAVFINPVFVPNSKQVRFGRETCFSVDDRVSGFVPRFSDGTIFALDQTGNSLAFPVTGYQSVLFQHEIDHLDGYIFPDRILYPRHIMLRDKAPELYRKLRIAGKLQTLQNPYPHRGNAMELNNLVMGRRYDASFMKRVLR